ncbi:hypothetical protein R1flu_022663 [Riccia fluitans]|uniref:Uncharacterized protein n=1 Tax=Riccia fluitans TaxID=41844 RepID=A0ABD1XPW6_9MARC
MGGGEGGERERRMARPLPKSPSMRGSAVRLPQVNAFEANVPRREGVTLGELRPEPRLRPDREPVRPLVMRLPPASLSFTPKIGTGLHCSHPRWHGRNSHSEIDRSRISSGLGNQALDTNLLPTREFPIGSSKVDRPLGGLVRSRGLPDSCSEGEQELPRSMVGAPLEYPPIPSLQNIPPRPRPAYFGLIYIDLARLEYFDLIHIDWPVSSILALSTSTAHCSSQFVFALAAMCSVLAREALAATSFAHSWRAVGSSPVCKAGRLWGVSWPTRLCHVDDPCPYGVNSARPSDWIGFPWMYTARVRGVPLTFLCRSGFELVHGYVVGV